MTRMLLSYALFLLFALSLYGCGGAPLKQAVESNIRASRAFSGPHSFPPRAYAAYGILAFTARATTETRARLQDICEAYISSLPHSASLSSPPAQQMVTVWPIDSQQWADELNAQRQEADCGLAIKHYDLLTALQALHDAQVSGDKLSGPGPYLLAWSPASDKGKSHVPVLVADFSDVTNQDQALEKMRDWRRDIEEDPSLWKHGWDMDSIRLKIAHWADKYGAGILSLLGIQG